MSLTFFDTKRRQKVPFESLHPREARVYHCGPTVYDYAHIGNFRAYVFTDLLRRWLEAKGYAVNQVMNITDVDDKTIRRSREEGLPLAEFTDKYRTAFLEDLATLGILPAHRYPAATDHVTIMVELVKSLLEKGHAYKADDGSVYFSVSSFANYGTLSGKRLEDLRQGDRVASDEYESKDDVRDFALWKAWDEDDGDVFWETEIGKGRPGWHLECSAMSTEYLGEEFDIHTGGVDLIFPHHENEIAQAVCGIGSGFARHWLHNEHLHVEGKKMSKSLGNFFTLRDLLDKGYQPRAIRYVLAATHYRSKLNFTFDGLTAARTSLQRLDEFRESWAQYPDGQATAEGLEALARGREAFDDAMDDDLNVAGALSALFTMVREVNALAARGLATAGLLPALENAWAHFDHALGLLHPFDDEATANDDGEAARIEGLIEERKQARVDRDFARADEIRDQLAAEGIELRDGPEGTTWKRK